MAEIVRVIDLVNGTEWGKTLQTAWIGSQKKRIPITFRGIIARLFKSPYRIDPKRHSTYFPDAGVVVLHGPASEIEGVNREKTLYEELVDQESETTEQLQNKIDRLQKQNRSLQRELSKARDDAEAVISRIQGGDGRGGGDGPVMYRCQGSGRHRRSAAAWRENDGVCPAKDCKSENREKVNN